MFKIPIYRLKYIIIYSLLFVLLFFEHTKVIGEIKFSQVWKLPVYFAAFFYIINSSKGKWPNYLYYSFLIFVILIFNPFGLSGFLSNLGEAFGFFTLPFTIIILIIRFPNDSLKIRYFYVTLSAYLILFNVPFIFHLIPEVNMVTDLNKYGMENTYTLTGVFFHPNITSKIATIATIAIYANKEMFSVSKFSKLIYWMLVLLGIYSVFFTFIRTGWILIVFSFLFLIQYQESLSKKIRYLAPTLVVFIIISAYIFNTNESIRMRVLGETTYRTNDEFDTNQITSGRLEIWKISIENVIDDGLVAVLIGHSKSRALTKMKESYGFSIPSHNRFIEIFQYSGLIGLLIFFKLLLIYYKLIKKYESKKGDIIDKLPYCAFVIYIITLFPSHGFPLWADIIFGGIIASIIVPKNKKIIL